MARTLGVLTAALPPDEGYAEAVVAELRREGIHEEELAVSLQRDGTNAFALSWGSLIRRVSEKEHMLVAH